MPTTAEQRLRVFNLVQRVQSYLIDFSKWKPRICKERGISWSSFKRRWKSRARYALLAHSVAKNKTRLRAHPSCGCGRYP